MDKGCNTLEGINLIGWFFCVTTDYSDELKNGAAPRNKLTAPCSKQ
jgi:hypothetical protein